MRKKEKEKDALNTVQKLIKKYKLDAKDSGMMAKMMSDMGIKKEVDCDNSDAAISHMVIEGLTMGLVDIETKIKNFKDEVDNDVLELAKDYKKALEKEIEDLKRYL